jgi:hypothetical protein
VLPDGTRWELASPAPHITPGPVVTSMAGFAFAFPLLEGFSGLGLIAVALTPDPVVTSLAAFAGDCRPHPPGGRTGIPANFR